MIADGLLLVDKPIGISSFDVIRELRRRTGVRKIGHCGTLDPLASGLMLMVFGAACKQAERFSKQDKRYLAEVHFGANSTTGDREGDITPVSDLKPNAVELAQALVRLTGEIEQIPSIYSAIKIRGQEAYKRARAGETVAIPARKVTIYENQLVRYEYPVADINAKVSSGTYIRSLAEDLGRLLGCGAYLSGLVRTEVGEYKLDQALALSDANQATVERAMLDI